MPFLDHPDLLGGPQGVPHAPDPPWHGPADADEIIVLEPARPGTVLPLRHQPDLGRTTVVTPE